MPSWRVAAAGAVVAVAAQLFGLYRVTGPPTPSWFPSSDKLEHALGFALPVFLVLLTLDLRHRTRPGPGVRHTTALVVTAVFLAHAVLSEVIQHLFYVTRTGDPWDVVADSVGIAIGIAGHLLVSRSLPVVRARTS